NSVLADEALWWRGRIHEQEGELEAAASLYARIGDEYPGSSYTSDAAFRRGMIPFRTGAYLESAQIWASELDQVTAAAAKRRLQLWQGKALMLASTTHEAIPVLSGLIAEDESGYLGLRAASLRENIHEHHEAEAEATLN